MLRSRLRLHRAFTLIELLVVIVIIGILVAVALSSFLSQQQKARDTQAKTYLSYAVRSFRTSEIDKGGSYPPFGSLLADLAGSEPELAIVSASGWSAATGAPANRLVIDTAKTTASQVVAYVNVPGSNANRIWQATVPTNGPVIFSLVNTTFGGYYDKLVYTSGGTLTIGDLDGTNATNTGVSAQYPIWSPDGTKLLYYDGASLKTMNPDGSAQTAIPNTTDTVNWGQSFNYSADMTKIAYAGYWCCGSQDNVYTINADGTGKTNVLSAAANVSWVAYDADGTWVYLRRSGDLERVRPDGSGGLMTVRNDAANIFDPAFSPDRSKIAFDELTGVGSTIEIYVINADGTGEVRLTNNGVSESPPSWTADGKITYNRSGTRYQINADGTAETAIGASSLTGNSYPVCCGS